MSIHEITFMLVMWKMLDILESTLFELGQTLCSGLSSFLCRSLSMTRSSKVSPVFCNNLVVHHKPHLVATQFALDAAQLVDSFDFLEYPIKPKSNVGPLVDNSFKDYETEIAHWNCCACCFNIQLPELNLRSKLIGIPSESGDVSNTPAEGSSTLRRLVITTPSVSGSNYGRAQPTTAIGPSRLRISNWTS
ncbi:hypothetical protein TSUD_321790 [Trifolium subterraneum]|uniref:Uncharacterized protein n=1 Tax=Trifolium subterraneum TaxID=3900 RepID=A0A2Z6NIU1_TRISU|nr:hypothetical protein TSUD_321790 [Trifolium subterraneum]